MTGNDQQIIQVSRLRPGQILDCDIVGADGMLLLARGRRIEPTLLENLRNRGVEEVTLDGIDGPVDMQAGVGADAEAEASSRNPSAPTAGPASDEATPTVDPGQPLPPDAYKACDGVEPLPRLDETGFAEVSSEVGEVMGASMDRYSELAGGLHGGRVFDGTLAVDLLLGLRRVGDRDIDLASLMVMLQRPTLQPLVQHGVRHAVVAMRLARGTGLGPDAVLDAGLVSLFSDIGMSSVAEDLLQRPGRLSQTEWERVHRHCAASADLTAKIRGIRSIVSHAVYQHHERPNGTGYPKGRQGTFLHPLARIAAVADVFSAVMEPRTHRLARSPHHAVRATLEGVKEGRLDGSIVRALLAEVSLFPVGTAVELSNGRAGTVFRTDAKASDRPIVAFDDGQKPRKLELTLEPDLKIVRVEEPAAREQAAPA